MRRITKKKYIRGITWTCKNCGKVHLTEAGWKNCPCGNPK